MNGSQRVKCPIQQLLAEQREMMIIMGGRRCPGNWLGWGVETKVKEPLSEPKPEKSVGLLSGSPCQRPEMPKCFGALF